MTVPNIDPTQLAAFLAQLQAQQAAQAQQPQQFVQPGINPPVQPAAPQVPLQPTVPVSTEDAMADANRPKGYGPALFKTSTDQPGLTFAFTVAGPTSARQARNFTTKQPETYQDGRPKIELVIPLDVATTERHPEGRATLYSKGSLTTELSRAMAAAGAPQEVIKQGLEPGATGTITFQGKVTKQGKQATYTENAYVVTYNRPGQAAPTVATTNYAEQAQAQPAPAAQAPAPQPAPAAQAPAPQPAPAAQAPAAQAPAADVLAQLRALAAANAK